MRHSILRTLPLLSLLVGHIACAAVQGLSPSSPYDIDNQAADVDVQQPITYVENRGRANQVRNAFRRAWSGYKFATWTNGRFSADEICPNNRTISFNRPERNGWGATAIDALDTAIIMGEKEAVNDIVTHIKQINWEKSNPENQPVSLFETTIRYMGGILSGYDLLKSEVGRSLLAPGTSAEPLLDQAIKLGNRLSLAFTLQESPIPTAQLHFPTNSNAGGDSISLAEVGTLILEWTRLSDLSGDPKYFKMTDAAERAVMKQDMGTRTGNHSLDGLVGSGIDIKTATPDNSVHWNGGADSYYEYLMKMFVYDPIRFEDYGRNFALAANSTMRNLVSTTRLDPASDRKQAFLTVLNFDPQTWTSREWKMTGHLTCFAGGTFLLASAVMDKPDLRAFGERLVEACYTTYTIMASGIAPDWWEVDPRGEGIMPRSTSYLLRPEVLESIYYAYRITGNTKYQDWSYQLFTQIAAKTQEDYGFTAIEDVTRPDGGKKKHEQDSYFFAETLKYAYMIHADVNAEYQVQPPGKEQKWVFNTEAHPVKVNPTQRKR